MKNISQLFESFRRYQTEEKNKTVFSSAKPFYLSGLGVALLALCSFFLTPFLFPIPIPVSSSVYGTTLAFSSDFHVQLIKWDVSSDQRMMEIQLALQNKSIHEPNLLIDLFDDQKRPVQLTIPYDNGQTIFLQASDLPASTFFTLNVSLSQEDSDQNNDRDETSIIPVTQSFFAVTEQMNPVQGLHLDKTPQQFQGASIDNQVAIHQAAITEKSAQLQQQVDQRNSYQQLIHDLEATLQSQSAQEEELTRRKIAQAQDQIMAHQTIIERLEEEVASLQHQIDQLLKTK